MKKMMTAPRRYILIFFLSLLIVNLIACSSGSGFRILKNELTVRQFPGNSPLTQSMAAVTGTATNPGESAIEECVITVIFYDDEKNKLGTGTATRPSLGPGEIWNFAVQITGPDAWKARTYDIIPSNK